MTDLNQEPQPIEPTEPTEPVTQSLLSSEPPEPIEPVDPIDPVDPQPEPITSIDDYKIEIEGFNFDEFKAIEENKEFLERAKEAGLDNKALGFLLGEYNELIPNLMQANAQLDNEACVTHMTDEWGADTSTNFKYAQAAAQNAIQNGILTPEEVNSPEFGNNPLVLKMAAHFGAQLQEDTPPSNTQQSSAVDVESLMLSEAYMNDQHPDHKKVYAQVRQAYAKQYK